MSNEKRRFNNQPSKDGMKKSTSRERRRLSPESQNSCEFKLSSRQNSHAEMPWSAKFGHPVTEHRTIYKTGKPTPKQFTHTQPHKIMTVHQKERNEISTLETIKARNNPLIDDRNNTISSAAPFQLDSPTKLENVMEIEEL